jgi:phosphotransferase system HPr-like phosphotransfer protein
MRVEKGMNLLITAEGNDEMIAVETLAALVNSGFGE